MAYSGFNVTGFRSTSNWEDSYWGGFKKVLWDHPEIKIDDGLEWKNNKTGDLGYYNFNKLIKLYLLHAKQNGLSQDLLNNLTSERITKWYKSFTRYTLDAGMIKNVAESLIDRRIELSNMFDHYKDVIKATTFYYDVPDEKKDKGSGQGSGNQQEDKDDKNDDKNDGESDEEKQQEQQEKVEQLIVKVLESVMERKPYTEQDDWYGGWGGESYRNPEFYIMPADDMIRYTEKEKLYAEQLVNMLNITFDPMVDKIGSLKSGKLEISKLCEIPSGNFNVYSRLEENIGTKPFSMCVLLDESGSMNKGKNSKLWHATSMMKILYRTFSMIIPQDKMYFYGHSGQSTPKISVYHDRFNQNFEKSIGHAGTYQANNYDGPVMNAIYNKIREHTDDNIIFTVISDGQPCKWGDCEPIPDMKRIIEKCKRDGFVTLGIGVQSDYVRAIYPYNTVVYNLQEEFVKKVSLLINQVVKQEFQS